MKNPMQSKSLAERREIAKKAHATRKARKEALERKYLEAKIYANGLREEIDALERKYAELERLEKMNGVMAAICNKTLIRSESIIKASLPWTQASGVYFLIDNDEIVYIGQSVNVYQRISQHADKKFDRYAFVPCEIENLDKLESLYIHVIQPRLNGFLNSGIKAAPLRLDELLNMERQ